MCFEIFLQVFLKTQCMKFRYSYICHKIVAESPSYQHKN